MCTLTCKFEVFRLYCKYQVVGYCHKKHTGRTPECELVNCPLEVEKENRRLQKAVIDAIAQNERLLAEIAELKGDPELRKILREECKSRAAAHTGEERRFFQALVNEL